MSENNGRNGWAKLAINFLAGALWFCLTTSIIIIATNVIANDKESRARDDKIKECIELKIENIQKEQSLMRKESSEQFTQILVAIAELKAKISNVK